MTIATEGQPSNDDVYASAFAEAAAPEAGPDVSTPAADPPATEEPAAAPAAPAAAPEGASAPAPETPAAPEAAPAGGAPVPAGETPAEPAPATPVVPATPAAPAGPTAEEIVAQLAARLEQPAPAAPAATAEQAPLYTEDETGLIAAYEKDWPEVAQAEALRKRGEYHDLTKYIFTEVKKFYDPYMNQLRVMQNSLHTQELTSKVEGYEPALEENVTAWIDSQPDYLQQGMKYVMQQGTSDQVADLIGRYRASTGVTQPASAAPAAPAAPTPPAPRATELSDAAKQAAASLAPVSGERTQAPAGEDPQDYGSAFARYAAEMSG